MRDEQFFCPIYIISGPRRTIEDPAPGTFHPENSEKSATPEGEWFSQRYMVAF